MNRLTRICALLILVGLPLSSTPVNARGPKIAIIIDDIGRDRGAEMPFLSLNAPLTFSLLPQYPYSLASAMTLLLHRHELMLHLPMEPLDKRRIDGRDFLSTTQPLARFSQLLRAHLGRIPGVVGVNGHMGSRLSLDRLRMRLILGACKRLGLFFVDSKTVADTVGYRLALQMGLPTQIRDVFIDNEAVTDKIVQALDRAKQLAKERGWVVVIGHPHRQTFRALRRWLQLPENRAMLVPVSSLTERHFSPRERERHSPMPRLDRAER